MKLVVPYTDPLSPLESRMMRLAEHLGIEHEPLRLARQAAHHAEFLERNLADRRICFLVNPQVVREWIGGDELPAELVSYLLARCQHLVVCGLHLDSISANIVAALSGYRVQLAKVGNVESRNYEIAKDCRDVCGPFAGLSFGPADPTNDHFLSSDDPAVRSLISIGGRTFMSVLQQQRAEVFFIAGEELADLDWEVGEATITAYFSRLVPHVMALRHIFGKQCWRPFRSYASVVMDDPLLKRSYGYLNFESLLRLMERHDFHTTVAFIPRNFRRSSPPIAKMFRENASRFSLCFHGNDHTEAEFACSDLARLNTMIRIAERRMNAHCELTGLACDRVMVFPQGKFSPEAMQALKSCNFHAAVNTESHPMRERVRLTLAELTQPAVLRYGGFPLFLRTRVPQVRGPEIAFNLFFGKPLLIVAHHDALRSPESLVEAVVNINATAPGICWTNLATVVSNSILERRAADGGHHIRAYSSAVQVLNVSDCVERFSIEWDRTEAGLPFLEILRAGRPVAAFEMDTHHIRTVAEIPPKTTETFCVVYRNEFAASEDLGLRWNAKAFLRRRLSEIRDNYLSKSPHLLAVANTVRRHLLH